MKSSIILCLSIFLAMSLLWKNHAFSATLAQSSITQNGPDLVVTTIEFDPPNPQEGDVVDIKVAVKNQGNQLAAPGFWNYLYLDPADEPPTETTSIFANVYRGETLKPSEIFTWWGIDYTYTGTDPVIYAVADPLWDNSIINEADEENNMLRFPALEPSQTPEPITATPMPTLAPDVPDVYELDDTCLDIADEPKITTDGTPQMHNLVSHVSSGLEQDVDRIRFDAIAGSIYRVRITPNDRALNITMAYDVFCDGELTLGSAEFELKPKENVTYYLSISYEETEQVTDTGYTIQVTESTPEATAMPLSPTLSPTPLPTLAASPTRAPAPTPTADKTWVMLIYAVGDNDLARYLDMGADGMLHRLHKAGVQPNVDVAVMYDGPDFRDTVQYLLKEDGNWIDMPMVNEAQMDEPETLQDFIQWGIEQYPDRTHYILALLDHANGVRGFGQDYTSDAEGKAVLAPQEMRDAIQNGLDRTELDKFDIIQVDGCSFGLFEDTFIFETSADYVIASPNTGWALFPYETYRRLAGESPGPLAYAKSIAKHYVAEVEKKKYPYTISIYDMDYYQTMHDSIDELGNVLLTYMENDTAVYEELQGQWEELQKYDANDYTLDSSSDQFVDLGHLISKLVTHEKTSIADAARTIQNGFNSFVVKTHNKSGDFIHPYSSQSTWVDLDNAQGLGIYYPKAPSSIVNSYLNNEIFVTLTKDWGWRNFLSAFIPPGPLGPSTTSHTEVMLAPLPLQTHIFMPYITR